MRRNILLDCALALVALALATLGACAAYQHQHAAAPAPAATPAVAATAEPAVPAGAPVSAEFRTLADGAQLARVRGEVEEAKRNLAAKGRYACCVHPSCNECLLHRGECHCRHEVEKNGPCCGECTEAWIEGHGAVEGLNALELLERKKRAVREKQGGEPQHEHQHQHP
jgi:hypothetical protein